MKKLLIILLSVLSLTVVAQQKKVAVYVTGEQSGISKVLGDQLVTAFTRSGKYVAVERTASFLAELGREQNYQRSGAVSDNQISRLGKQFGVQLVCVADVSEVFGEKYVSARLIDVETAEVINSANTNSSLNSMDELVRVSNNIATSLAGKTGKEISYENQQKEAQRAEQIRMENAKRQQEQQAQQEEYNRLKNASAVGYIQMDRLMVAIPDFAQMTYAKAIKYAKSCSIGGFSGWRLPTQSELRQILSTSEIYHKKCSDFPDFKDESIYRRHRGYYYYNYWCQNKYYYEYREVYDIYWGNSGGKFGQGTMDDTLPRECYVILVRDK